jgi:hypothetical protein
MPAATVERGSPNIAIPARDWRRETRHVGDEVHRHPAVTTILDVHGKTAGSTLSPLTEPPAERKFAFCSGYK